MNARLATMKDGTGRGQMSVHFAVKGVTCDRDESGEIYWPFALSWDGLGAPDLYVVTHLPSGYFVLANLRRRQALSLVRRLRALKVDYSFTKPSGTKWEAAKLLMAPIVKAVRNKR